VDGPSIRRKSLISLSASTSRCRTSSSPP
jgi:hypothetical protein